MSLLNSIKNFPPKDFNKMIDNFRKVKETTENTLNNKFRQVADDEWKEIGKSITKVQLDTPNKVYGLTKKFVNCAFFRNAHKILLILMKMR